MGLIRNTFILKNEVFDTGSDLKFKSVREFISLPQYEAICKMLFLKSHLRKKRTGTQKKE